MIVMNNNKKGQKMNSNARLNAYTNPTLGAQVANNIYPNFVGANGEEGVTVTKPLHDVVIKEMPYMYMNNSHHCKLQVDNGCGYNIYGMRRCQIDTYDIYREGNYYTVIKTNSKGKVFVSTLYMEWVGEKSYTIHYKWKTKLKPLMDGHRVKMRMFAPQQVIAITKTNRVEVA